jgi:hypothetical protein
MKYLCVSFLMALISALHFFCTNSPVAGPSTEQPNPQIVAVVIDSSTRPIAGITVTAYRVINYSDSLQQPPGATSVAVGQTNADGRCAFDKLPAGAYSLEAADTQTGKRALSSGVVVTKPDSHFFDTLRLAYPGAITGVVSRGGISGTVGNQNKQLSDAAIMVIIQEIETAPRITAQDGKYRFSGLPAGTYTVFYYATDGFYSAKKTVVVKSGDTVHVDTTILRPLGMHPPKGFTFRYSEKGPSGSGAAIVNFSWNRVVYDSLRFYEVERIDLTGSFDKLFTTTDTLLADTLTAIPVGTTLNYVVRSVDRAFNRSANAGPLEVVVK